MSVGVLEKAFQLLETLATADEPVSLKVITDEAGLPKPTVCRLLRSMHAMGYVGQDRKSGEYFLGVKASQLGRGDKYHNLKETAAPLMQEIHEVLDETVNLGVLNGESVYYIDFLETSQALRWIVKPSQVDPYYSTALGRAIVAWLEEEEMEKILGETDFRKITGCTVSTRAAIRKVLTETRQRGYAEEREETVDGVVCFAVPLALIGEPYAAISISVPVQRLDQERESQIVEIITKLTETKKYE